MSEAKTKAGKASVPDFLAALDDPRKRQDCQALATMMSDITGKEAVLWGSSIIGFGSYHYRYQSGREGDSMVTGFAPRKQNIAIYIMPGFSQYVALLAKLGKHKTGKSCLYIKTLEQVDTGVLRQLIATSVADMAKRHDCT